MLDIKSAELMERLIGVWVSCGDIATSLRMCLTLLRRVGHCVYNDVRCFRRSDNDQVQLIREMSRCIMDFEFYDDDNF